MNVAVRKVDKNRGRDYQGAFRVVLQYFSEEKNERECNRENDKQGNPDYGRAEHMDVRVIETQDRKRA